MHDDYTIVNEYQNLRDEIRQRIFRDLNSEQIKVVANGEGPLLCLAGAGSGKTMAMVFRVLHLYLFGARYEKNVTMPEDIGQRELSLMRNWLEDNNEGRIESIPLEIQKLIRVNGIPSRYILAITFTNKAAQEMKSRLQKVLDGTLKDMWVMTFHAACVRILHREIKSLGYANDFVIYDTHDQDQLLKDVISGLNIDEKKFPPRMFRQIISRYKSKLLKPGKAKLSAADYYEQKGAEVYEIYQKRLQSNNAVDFDDLIMQTVNLLSEHPLVLEKYQDRFRYIMVDEYQDTNHAQYKLVNLLASRFKNICVVGDDDQSIYGFRQADIRNILDFERDYPQAQVVKLEQNYRSTRCILQSANEVIQYNFGRKDKKLWTENPEGDEITQYRADDEQDEACFVAEQIRKLVDAGNKYQDFAVLMRTNAQSRVLEEWFMKRSIPFKIFGGLRFYERKEIKDILAYLKVLVNNSDSVSLKRIINVPRRGIGDATLKKIQDFADKENISLYDALKRYQEIDLSAKVNKAVKGFIEMMASFKEFILELNVTELTEKLLAETGYWQELTNDKTVESQNRIENLKEFITSTKEYDQSTIDSSLNDFLSGVSLVSDLDNYEDENNVVVVMTMHMAKGLEFPNVFLLGMEEGIFPHSRALHNENELEEERRLCYVGITRAKERLYMINARQRNLYGRRNYNMPSRFLADIPAKYIKEYKREEDFFNTIPSSISSGEKQGQGGGYNVGDKVEHRKWGQGVIVSIKGENDDIQLQIAFPEQGIKTLLAKYAPLQKVT